MNLFTKNLIKISSGLCFGFAASLTFASGKAQANDCQSLFGSNPSSIDGPCYITPDTYKVTIFEMGLCADDPLDGTYESGDDMVTDNTIDESSCTKTFESASGGITVDLASTTPITLTGTHTRPADGTYPHAYIKIKNVFGVKGTYELASSTFCSAAGGGSDGTSGCTATEFDDNLYDFQNGSTCSSPSPFLAGSETFTSGVTGTMKALLATPDSSGTYVGDTSCGSSTRIFGSFEPTSPITISGSTSGLDVQFTVTNRGMTVIPFSSGESAGTAIEFFGGGPFSPAFETY